MSPQFPRLAVEVSWQEEVVLENQTVWSGVRTFIFMADSPMALGPFSYMPQSRVDIGVSLRTQGEWERAR